MKALIFPEWGAPERCPLTIMRSPAWSSASFSFLLFIFVVISALGRLRWRTFTTSDRIQRRSWWETWTAAWTTAWTAVGLRKKEPESIGLKGLRKKSDCRRSTSVRTLITSAVSNVLYSCIIFHYYLAVLCYFMSAYLFNTSLFTVFTWAKHHFSNTIFGKKKERCWQEDRYFSPVKFQVRFPTSLSSFQVHSFVFTLNR